MEGNFTVALTDVNEPSYGNVQIIGKTEVGENLSVSHSLSDPEGLGSVNFEWLVNDQTISFGGRIQDGINGADGLRWARGIAISPDGLHLYACIS